MVRPWSFSLARLVMNWGKYFLISFFFLSDNFLVRKAGGYAKFFVIINLFNLLIINTPITALLIQRVLNDYN